MHTIVSVGLTDSVIQTNTAGTEHGGGFYNYGTVELVDTGILNNSNGTHRDDHGGLPAPVHGENGVQGGEPGRR